MDEEKGISFNYMTEDEAEDYLLYRNNYLRTAAFRKCYEKYTAGDKKGKYINLDFAYLAELSTLDMHFRFIILKMCMDIEHALKVQLVREIETNNLEDGYSIVREVFSVHKFFKDNIIRKADSPNCEGLIKSSFVLASVYKLRPSGRAWMSWEILKNDCSVWTFLECCSFGDLLKYYNFYFNKYDLLPRIDEGILNSIKSIRNTCAHNNCLMFDLKKKETIPAQEILRFISSIPQIGRSLRANRLSVRPVYEFTCLCYVYLKVTSEKVKKHRLIELKDFISGRMLEKNKYFEKNETITRTFEFLVKLVDFLQ